MSYEDIVKQFAETDEQLRALVQQLEDGNLSARRIEQLNREIEQIVAELAGRAGIDMATLISNEYRAGAGIAVNQIVAAGVARDSINTSVKSLQHQRAAQAISDETFYSILEATDHMAVDTKQRIKQAVQLANEKSLTLGMSRREATKQAVSEVNTKGITGIITKSGAEVPADKYMAGVIHYHQRKAHVTGTENMAAQNGYDLVFVNYVGITCEHCARKQGRVYSLSGNDKRWPHMTDEYKPPYHSHCVHSMSIWIEEYQSPEEVARLMDISNRLGEETRSEQHIKRYKELQKQKARANETRKQWMRYKSVLPHDTPDLRTFASQKARGTARYKELQELYREANVINSKMALPKNTAAISFHGKNVIMVKDDVIQHGPQWKQPELAQSHLNKRIKRKQIPEDWTLQDYNNKITDLVQTPNSQVYRYWQEGFSQEYYVYGDGKKWISIVGEDGKMETAFPLDSPAKYRSYMTVEKGYTYLGTVEEVEKGVKRD